METLTASLVAAGVEVFTALAHGRFHDPERYAKRHSVANPIAVDGTLGYREVRISNLLDVFETVSPDIIIPANLSDAITAAAYWKTRGSKARLVICLHGQGGQQLEQVRAMSPFIDLFTSVSRRVTNELAAIANDDARVRHIPTGVPGPLTSCFSPRGQIHEICYVGRLEQMEKRVLDCIPFMEALSGTLVRLHVIGRGMEEDRLRSGLAGLPVEFHGELSRQQLYESIYPMMDAIVIFSEAEAGPIVVWEAMMHGVVPVVSDFRGRAEEGVLHDGENTLVFPVGDPAIAASKVRAFTEEGALLALSRMARLSLPQAYNLSNFASAWQEALHDCMRMKPRTGTRSQLPSLKSPGKLAGLPLSVERAAWLRKVRGIGFEHQEPGSEWPH
jgi:glycosyltransferase involved in cell wall biosynthesis